MVAAEMERRLWIQVYWDGRCGSTWKKVRNRTPGFWLEWSNKWLEQVEFRKGHRGYKPQTLLSYSITKCILNLGQSPLFISNLIALFLSLNNFTTQTDPFQIWHFLTFSYFDLDTLMHNVKFKAPSCPHYLCKVGSCAPCPMAPKCFVKGGVVTMWEDLRLKVKMLGPMGSKSLLRHLSTMQSLV